jgi:outer membrane protein assembly factor BamB
MRSSESDIAAIKHHPAMPEYGPEEYPMSRSLRLALGVGCFVGLAVCGSRTGLEAQRGAAPLRGDWTEWRGPNRDAVAPGFTAPAMWPEMLTPGWKIEVGTGYANPLVVGPRLYMFSRQGEDEVMTALDAAKGTVIWRQGYPAPFTMNKATARHGPGPKSVPIFADGRLFSIGMTGVVTARDAATGKALWQKPGSSVVPTFTTHAFSPIVDGGAVIFHIGGNNQGALTSFDAATGNVRWSWPGDGPSYGSPIIAELDGTRQLITLTQTKLVGVDVATGSLLWERPFTNSSVTNSATPILFGRTVVVSNGGPVMAYTVAKRGGAWVVEDAWQNADAPYRLSNTVVAPGDMLFGLSTRNAGQYFGVDLKTGATLWTSEGRQATQAAIVRSGEFLFSLEDDGELVVLRASRTGFDPIRRYKVSDAETWTPPVLSNRRIFIKDVSTLALWTVE